MALLTQLELEQKMYAHGKALVRNLIESNEDEGKAHLNPYTPELYSRFILPLAQHLTLDLQSSGAGRHAAHKVLLKGMDPEVVAFLTVRAILSTCMAGDVTVRDVDAAVGNSVKHEQMLRVFEHLEPALFHTLVEDFGRKLSKSERHRLTVVKMQAKANGIELPEWGVGATQVVGQYLIQRASDVGLVDLHRETEVVGGKAKTVDYILLSAAARERVDQIVSLSVAMAQYATPCVEPPVPWTELHSGGFHTKEMRRVYPLCVKCSPSARDYLQANPSPTMLRGLNILQSARWRINSDLLGVVEQVAKHFDMDEILSAEGIPPPPRPDFLDLVPNKEDMNEDQLREFVDWKRERAEWHTQMKLRGTRWGRYSAAIRVAREFKDYPALYFVYFADFRGRFYCRTTGVSPQGSDLQKALLQPADGKPLSSPEALWWWKIAGANRFGWDKLSLNERADRIDQHHDMLIDMANDPINNRQWTEADSPMQFMAWLLEYRDYHLNPKTFLSRIIVGMDGSCNGLQNFSAMLRDELGGKATNLVPSALPQDIYDRVAKRTTALLEAYEATEEADIRFKQLWLSHGINRTLVKRSVMTLPYGSTRFSCADFIVSDYLRLGKALIFEKLEYNRAAQFLSHFVWDAIGDVVVKAREAMDWLQNSASLIIKEGADEIQWITPTGFPVVQHYWKSQVHQVRTLLHGTARIKVHTETDVADIGKHRNGVAPNFIHSMDASHMCLTTVAATEEGVGFLAMIHDDYGTHAADAAKLFRVIREQFVQLYEAHDPLRDFHVAYPFVSAPPSKGELDIRMVLSSPYFFS